jgi:hypothetical protein
LGGVDEKADELRLDEVQANQAAEEDRQGHHTWPVWDEVREQEMPI